MDNDYLDPSKIEEVKDDVDYYIEVRGRRKGGGGIACGFAVTDGTVGVGSEAVDTIRSLVRFAQKRARRTSPSLEY